MRRLTMLLCQTMVFQPMMLHGPQTWKTTRTFF
jgi:hypothetical protein